MSGQNALNAKQPPIQSTAGAVPVRNDKGKLYAKLILAKRPSLASFANMLI